MNQLDILILSQYFLIFTFLVINLGYFGLLISSLFQLKETIYARFFKLKNVPINGFESPISILVPAFNESNTIILSIYSLLKLNYPNFEIIVINDGSTDNTFELLDKEFDLVKIDEFDQIQIKTKNINGFYKSLKNKKIRVINKENGGKSDALNAGINASKFPYFCCVDADSILEKNSLLKMIEPFLEDSKVIAVGGSIRVANGCKFENGKIKDISVPLNPLSLIQVTEYVHAFLFGRLGWVPLNSLLILSGAFSLFSKKHVINVGGYKTNTIGEDMELVVRLHKYMRQNKEPYKISFVSNSICWTEVPQTLETLKKQRIRWQVGLAETLLTHRNLLFNKKFGIIGLFSFPFLLFVEFLTPIFEFIGYSSFLISYILEVANKDIFYAFLMASIGLGILTSISGIFVDELSFQIYKSRKNLFLLCIAGFLENLGYRQLNSYWRLIGIFRFIFKKKNEWGVMKHQGI